MAQIAFRHGYDDKATTWIWRPASRGDGSPRRGRGHRAYPARRRVRRGPHVRAVDARLFRAASLLLIAPLLLLLFTTTRTGPLPSPALLPHSAPRAQCS